jgi:hypothetical protein
MNEKQTEESSRKRSRKEAAEVVEAFEASGLTQVAFCQQYGIAVATLTRYRRWRAEGGVSAKERWLAVEVSDDQASRPAESGGKLAVALARGRRIEVGCGFDSKTLEQLIQLLERI